MGFLRYLLFPFSVLYMVVMSLRNFLFSVGVFKSTTYAVPSLGIGNLSTGGTGKSVAINYFLSLKRIIPSQF
jgi:tetraacyldisaccharide 4'-kinase